jgi:prophage regulatory protein
MPTGGNPPKVPPTLKTVRNTRQSTQKQSTEVLPRTSFSAIINKGIDHGSAKLIISKRGIIMSYNKKLLTLAQVVERVAQSKSTIYRSMDAGSFPRPIKLGSRMVRWLSDDIDTYLSRLCRSV